MIRFIVRSINLEYWDTAVDMVTQIERFNHLQDRAKPTCGDRLGSIGKLQLERRRVDRGRRRNMGFIDAVEKSALALLQSFS